MTLFLIEYFESLKKLVLSVAELKNVSPSDCKTLSILIFRKTNQQVSETTLKRVYGFAYSKFKPSLFTMDTMARFCGYGGWADFCSSNVSEANNTGENGLGWYAIKQNADKITRCTLQAIKNRSGIPYDLTIKRKFIDEHFDAFLKDNAVATVIASPAGLGKTIGLCHWIDEKMAITEAGNDNDIILFFSSNALINVFISGKDINDWLLSLLGYGNEDDFLTLLNVEQKYKGNFYLIVDGLDEYKFKNNQFQSLLNEVMDVFSFYADSANFKMVLTMRLATWMNSCSEFEDFKSRCFVGFPVGEEELTNVPVFSNQEINELNNKINPQSNNNVDFELLNSFRHPLYLQYFYKQHRLDFSLNKADNLSIYELVSTFILNKVYLDTLGAEKIILLKLLVESMDFANEKFVVDKLKVSDAIKKYSHAYTNLLEIGFIRDLNKSDNMYYNTVIEFGNDHLLNYSIAHYLLSQNNNVFDLGVAQKINKLFTNGRKLAILKWSVFYAAKNGQYNVCEFLAEILLTAKERLDVTVFIGDIIEKEYPVLKNPQTLTEKNEQ